MSDEIKEIENLVEDELTRLENEDISDIPLEDTDSVELAAKPSIPVDEINTIEMLINGKAKEIAKKNRMFDSLYLDRFHIHLLEGDDWAVMTSRGVDEDDKVRIILYYEYTTFLAIFKSQDLWDSLIKPALKKVPLLYNNSKEPFASAFKVWYKREYGKDAWLKMKYNVNENEILDLVTQRVQVEETVIISIYDPFTGMQHKVEKTKRLPAKDLPLNMQLALHKELQVLDRARFADCENDEDLAEREIAELKQVKQLEIKPE